MFERLAGKVLNRLLSKYFVSPDESASRNGNSAPTKTPEKKSSSWTQLGVWSGYVSLENLELREEVVNDILRSKGLPIEIVQCTLGRVEITVPWAKLNKQQKNGSPERIRLPRREMAEDNKAVIGVVLDGVHLLVRSQYDFDDEALRKASIDNRRQKLQDSEILGKSNDNKSSAGVAGFFQKRLAEGILKDILGKIHIHVRDVHIRLEDVDSDPLNPFACGVTLESLHIQTDEELSLPSSPTNEENGSINTETTKEMTNVTSGVIRKIAQLNHFAVYWNALGEDGNEPLEFSVMHKNKNNLSPVKLAQQLDRCIARRSPLMGSPGRHGSPNHSYLLLPIDGICRAALSTNPRSLGARPALVASFHIDPVTVQIRDFQSGQLIGLVASAKEHNFAKQYRHLRPEQTVKANPRAWWSYAIRIIRSELRESNMRWSWTRFKKRIRGRKRYCELYERYLRHPVSFQHNGNATDEGMMGVVPIQNGASDAMAEAESSVDKPLSEVEAKELQDIEDGLRGGLSVNDIVLFRALVKSTMKSGDIRKRSTKMVRLRRMVSSVISDDTESQQELESALAYLENATAANQVDTATEGSQSIAVSIEVHLQEGRISLFSPLLSTSDLHQHRRLHERFLDFRLSDLSLIYSLFGNFKSSRIDMALEDFVGTEIRSNRKEYVIVSRAKPDEYVGEAGSNEEPTSMGQEILASSSFHVESDGLGPLGAMELLVKPLDTVDCDVRLTVRLDALEIALMPDCEWLNRTQNLVVSIPKLTNVSSFWEDISMAHINSLDSAISTFRAKADAALFDRKNVDIDLHVNCPILGIGDGKGGCLIADLGRAHFVTEKLAGVAAGRLNLTGLNDSTKHSDATSVAGNIHKVPASPIQNERNRSRSRSRSRSRVDSFELAPNSHQVEEPPSPSRGLNNFFLGSSASSVGSKSQLRISSAALTESFRLDGNFMDDHSQSFDPLQSCFYDVFQLRLFAGSLVFSNSTDGEKTPLMKSFEIRVKIEKSVIPSDHTLCRLKTNCCVDNIALVVSEDGVRNIGGLVRTWKETLRAGISSTKDLPRINNATKFERRMTIRSKLQLRADQLNTSRIETASVTTSLLNEDEFIDALGDDENYEGVDDDWVVDTDSSAIEDNKSHPSTQRRRRLPSVSDVSSISDSSQIGGQMKLENSNYLSAENLAILDETRTGMEENESDVDSDDASFHSAMSLGGQVRVSSALEDDIFRIEGQLVQLKDDLVQVVARSRSVKNADAPVINLSDANEIRDKRNALKLDIHRLEVELRALQAAHVDLENQLSIAEELNYDEQLKEVENGVSTTIRPNGKEHDSGAGVAAAHAQALMRALKQRTVSEKQNGFGHSLTSGLNRDLLRLTLKISRISLEVVGVRGDQENKDETIGFELSLDNYCLSVLRRVNETKLVASIDNFNLFAKENSSVRTEHSLLVGGAMPSLKETLMPYQFPQQVHSSSSDEKFLRIGVDLGRRTVSSTFSIMKLRMSVGDIEASPYPKALSAFALFYHRNKDFFQVIPKAKGGRETEKESLPKPFIISKICHALVVGKYQGADATQYVDLYVRVSSVRVRLTQGGRSIGAMVVTDTSVRLGSIINPSMLKCRSQFDFRCANIQVLQIVQADQSDSRELLGRRDPFNPMIRMRLRIQLVPDNEVGGWVVDRDSLLLGKHPSKNQIWNFHCGVKTGSIYAVASLDGVEKALTCAKELVSAVKIGGEQIKHEIQDKSSMMTIDSQEKVVDLHIRWRADISVHKVSIVFPRQLAQDLDLLDKGRKQILVTFSCHATAVEAANNTSAVACRYGVTNLSCVRSSDDWPLLEDTDIICETILKFNRSLHEKYSPVPLEMAMDSLWQENSNLLSCDNWESVTNVDEMRKWNTATYQGIVMSVSVSVTPIRINVSPESCCLLIDTMKALKRPPGGSENLKETSGHMGRNKEINKFMPSKIRMYIPVIEAKLLEESSSGSSISQANSLASFCMDEMVSFAYHGSLSFAGFMRISQVSIYDFSSLPGVRVLGEEISDIEGLSPPFVTLSFDFNRDEIKGNALEVGIKWGHIQFIILPSLLRSMLKARRSIQNHLQRSTGNHSKDQAAQSSSRTADPLSELEVPFGVRSIRFSFVTSGFDCIIPTKDILSLLNGGPAESLSVVTLRWQTELKGVLALSNTATTDADEMLRAINLGGGSKLSSLNFEGASVLLQQFMDTYISGGKSTHVRNPIKSTEKVSLSRTLGSKVEFTVYDFQALRTCIRRVPHKADQDSKQATPTCFIVRPPIDGEQRITNQIKCKLTYQLAATSLSVEHIAAMQDGVQASTDTYVFDGIKSAEVSQTKVAQALQVDTGYVDILVYIRQSSGGMSDAVRVTLRPILDMLRIKEDVKGQKTVQSASDQKRDSPAYILIGNATTLCSLRAQGFQATCVPGGATCLTESPIVKCAFSNISVGFVATAVPNYPNANGQVARGTKGTFVDIDSPFQESPTITSHLAAGGWVSCEISGSYHNRRLVAWEPFLEPWTLDARVGIDFTQIFQLKSLPLMDLLLWMKHDEDATSSGIPAMPENLNERAGEKIRDFRRLLRSRFKRDASQELTTDSRSSVETHSDLSFLMLASMDPSLVTLALHPSYSVPLFRHLSKQENVSLLPGSSVVDWLGQFGYPLNYKETDEGPTPGILLSFSDRKPLNVNLTGALIDNVVVYMKQQEEERSKPVAPHWIRNDTGMTIRFREVLDNDRIAKGEKSRKTTLSSGREIPLSLKRATSQSCDPHRGHIFLELGSFEDVAGRCFRQKDNKPRSSLSSDFYFHAAGKISVDTVGVRTYQLNHSKGVELQNTLSPDQAPKWLIARVELRGGIKVVSLESPLVLKNNADIDLLCQVRDRGVGKPLIWKAVVPRTSSAKRVRATNNDGSNVPVPVDIITSVDNGAFSVSITAISPSSMKGQDLFNDSTQSRSVRVAVPPPFSQKSVRRGVVGFSEISLEPAVPSNGNDELVHLNICSLRIGSITIDSNSRSLEAARPIPPIPEQRMLLFRAPILFRNCLPVPIKVQVRVNGAKNALKRPLSSNNVSTIDFSISRSQTFVWEDLGFLLCGESISWAGAVTAARVVLRLKICENDGEESNNFPCWSTTVILPTGSIAQGKENPADSSMFPKMVVKDTAGVPLAISVGIEDGLNTSERDSVVNNNIRHFAGCLPAAHRVVDIFVPFWIVDGTGQELEFLSNYRIAGQNFGYSSLGGTANDPLPKSKDAFAGQPFQDQSFGLAGVLENEKVTHINPRAAFDILMIGDEGASRLSIRSHSSSLDDATTEKTVVSPWSDSVALQVASNLSQDIAVAPPKVTHGRRNEPLALRSHLVDAPERFGGSHQTRLIHVVNRYTIMNELGREVEIISENRQGNPVIVGDDFVPTPFHFDDSDRIRLRPREFGWEWSGPLSLRKERREVMMRLRHKLKGGVLILNVEFYSNPKSPGILVLLRRASHPPFRLENHTMHPLKFGQSSRFRTKNVALDNMLLAYHNVDFAWDEPDMTRRSVLIEVADFAYSKDSADVESKHLGSFQLDKIAPGTTLDILDSAFTGEVVADGPTRVLRIREVSLANLPANESTHSLDDTKNIFYASQQFLGIQQWINVDISHGIGISVVDYIPRELLYLRVENIRLKRRVVSGGEEQASITIGCVTANNQLWLTPYPVLMKIGESSGKNSSLTLGPISRTEKQAKNAAGVNWRRSLNSHGGHGDLTLLENIELKMEPLVVSIDGNLLDCLINMAIQVKGSTFDKGGDSIETIPRDMELRQSLGISDYSGSRPPKKQSDSRGKMVVGNLSSAESYFKETAAMAAKLARLKRRKRYSHDRGDPSGYNSSRKPVGITRPEIPSVPIPTVRHKFYIDKLKISTIKSEVSWSGALPGSIFSIFGFVRPAFAFEGLPVLLRQYANTHTYGTIEEHVQNMKSHYLNIWRFLDNVVGLAFKPTVMVRACLYTSRETAATTFDGISQALKSISGQQVYRDGMLVEERSNVSHTLYGTFFQKSSTSFVALFASLSKVASRVASSLRYTGDTRTQAGRAFSRSLRTRNPRLFANLDGRDLLVEYVQGENAGKAILSRVRMGMHLGEGYIWHMDGIHLRSKTPNNGNASTPMSTLPLILMMTSSRVLLLNGEQDANFCSVLWEAKFENIVLFELDDSSNPRYDVIMFWYLIEKNEESTAGHSTMVTKAPDKCLDLLLCKTFLVPGSSGRALRNHIGNLHKEVLEEI